MGPLGPLGILGRYGPYGPYACHCLGILYFFFLDVSKNHDFGHKQGRHKSWGRKNTGVLHRISPRTLWTPSRGPKSKNPAKKKFKLYLSCLSAGGSPRCPPDPYTDPDADADPAPDADTDTNADADPTF